MTNKIKILRRELSNAQACLDRMIAAEELYDITLEWESFLGAIERVWQKTEYSSVQSQNSRYQPWRGKFVGERKKDPLLRYMKNARDAAHHTIEDYSPEITPASQSIGIGSSGGSVYIEKLHMSSGVITEYSGSHPLEYSYRPESIRAVRVKNKSKWYNVPQKHLGVKIDDDHPITLASLTLVYYMNFVKGCEDYL